MLNTSCQIFKIIPQFVHECVWVCLFIYLCMEAGALSEEIRDFVKDFERSSVTWSDCKRQSVIFMV